MLYLGQVGGFLGAERDCVSGRMCIDCPGHNQSRFLQEGMVYSPQFSGACRSRTKRRGERTRVRPIFITKCGKGERGKAQKRTGLLRREDCSRVVGTIFREKGQGAGAFGGTLIAADEH
jgi:hypothetical protein